MPLIESIVQDAPLLQAVRRDIHAHPELCFSETRTSDLIAEQLRAWDIPVHRGLGKTGVVGIIKGRNTGSGKVVGLRADMDALPLTEITGLAQGLAPRMDLSLIVRRADGRSETATVRCRIDTVDEVEYFKAGGILHFVLNRLAAA